jgi:hypothetical protein
MITEIQEIIEKNRAGIRKLPGTVLKNEATGEVIYSLQTMMLFLNCALRLVPPFQED